MGRIVRDLEGQFVKIVEQKDASEEETAITEINTGCYAFDGKLLLETLDRIRPSNSQSEYYLTDCPAILRADGHEVFAKERFDIHEAMGVNTPDQLAEVQTILQTATA